MLNEGIVDMPMLWQTDAFALATGFDETAHRYIGLWIPRTRTPHLPPPTRSCSSARMSPSSSAKPNRRARARPSPTGRTEGSRAAVRARPGNRVPQPPPSKTRFYGVKTLSADKIALDFKNIADEVLTHFREPSTDLVVKIEIEATDPSGFDESQVRTVSENAKTLKFDQSGFEES